MLCCVYVYVCVSGCVKVILAASCGIEAQKVVAYKPLLDGGLAMATHEPHKCVILQRPQVGMRSLSSQHTHDTHGQADADETGVCVCSVRRL